MADDRSASMLELKAIDAPTGHYDVAILGGGLAGLTIAIQLKRERPETRVLVTDKRTEPAPEAAFKVGESSVEIGAYYYREMIGMRDHLEKYQQRKLGLRFFMPAGDNSDITKRVEFCTPGHLDAFTHQIDRGRFENELFRRARKAGVDAFRGWRVQDVSLGADTHTILMSQEDEECIATARWVVTRADARTSCGASSGWARASTPGITATRPGSGSPAAWTSRTGPTTRSGSAGCPRRACASTRPRT